MSEQRDQIIAVMAHAAVDLRTAQIARAIGSTQQATGDEMMRMRADGLVELVPGAWRLWRLRVKAPSNVIPLRPAVKAPLRMLPVIRREDCAHEPACSMAAARAWPEADGMTCPAECAEYRPGKREPVSVQRSNWMGGE